MSLDSVIFRAFLLAVIFLGVESNAEPIAVLYPQGSAHGFVAIRDLSGACIAVGDMTQNVRGDRIVSKLIFRFRDGSIDSDTTVFTQRGTFRLISDHHIQHGPSFPEPSDVLINALTGQITWHTKKGEIKHEQLDLPADVSNGLPPNLLMNLHPSTPETKISYVAPTDKPRLIHITIKPVGELAFAVGGMKHKAVDYLLHVELGGITGIIAPLIGKQPADFHIWIEVGSSPAFIREEGALYLGGPIWRIEQISPAFSN